jgi:hypothetical protein
MCILFIWQVNAWGSVRLWVSSKAAAYQRMILTVEKVRDRMKTHTWATTTVAASTNPAVHFSAMTSSSVNRRSTPIARCSSAAVKRWVTDAMDPDGLHAIRAKSGDCQSVFVRQEAESERPLWTLRHALDVAYPCREQGMLCHVWKKGGLKLQGCQTFSVQNIPTKIRTSRQKNRR